MRKIALKEFDSFPIINGIKYCPPGIYVDIKNFNNCAFAAECFFAEDSVFGDRCSFGERCFFDKASSFGEWCRFGSGCSFDERCLFGIGAAFGEHCKFAAKCKFEGGCSFGEYCFFEEHSAFDEQCNFSKSCSFGVESTFGEQCDFGSRCVFDARCVFGTRCSFGEFCNFADKCVFNGKVAKKGHPILAFFGAGGYLGAVYAFNVEGGPLIEDGSFSGTLDEFRVKAQDDCDKLKSLQQLTFANLVTASWCPEKLITDHHNANSDVKQEDKFDNLFWLKTLIY
jgi:hypothetical protein